MKGYTVYSITLNKMKLPAFVAMVNLYPTNVELLSISKGPGESNPLYIVEYAVNPDEDVFVRNIKLMLGDAY